MENTKACTERPIVKGKKGELNGSKNVDLN